MRLKLIPPSQINSFLFLNIVYFERTVVLGVEDYFNNQDLNCKVLNKCPTRQEPEILVLELKLSKTNWLVIGTYKPPSLSDIAFTSEVSNILTFISQHMTISYSWVILIWHHMVSWRRGVVVITTAQLHSTKSELRFKPCSRRVGDSRWWGSLTMVPAGNKAKRLSSVNHTTKKQFINSIQFNSSIQFTK